MRGRPVVVRLQKTGESAVGQDAEGRGMAARVCNFFPPKLTQLFKDGFGPFKLTGGP